MPPDSVLPELCRDFDELLQLLPGSSCRTGPGYRVQVCPQVPAPLFCGVWVTDAALDATIAGRLDQLIGEVEAADVPASLLLPDHVPLTTRAATELGFTESHPHAGMLLAGPVSPPHDAARIAIREAHSPGELREALTACAAGFGAPPEAFEPLYSPAVAAHPGVRIYLGDVDGHPVTTGVGFLAGGGVGVYSVATLPNHRRRGYGGEIVRRIVLDGFQGGARSAYLLASELGVGVYERVGFTRAARYHLATRPGG
jgi:GNAT superfamily N-acetyltransferase